MFQCVNADALPTKFDAKSVSGNVCTFFPFILLTLSCAEAPTGEDLRALSLFAGLKYFKFILRWVWIAGTSHFFHQAVEEVSVVSVLLMQALSIKMDMLVTAELLL